MSEIQKESYEYEKVWEKLSKSWINIRSAIISTLWKVLHIVISNSNKSLEETSKKYLEKTWIKTYVDKESFYQLENFKQSDRWVIITTHKSWVFSDYLPIFAKLWDEILKKSIFYTWEYNLNMNKREFPDYEFRATSSQNIKSTKAIIEKLYQDIKNIKNNWGYIFIIPSLANIEENWEFKWIFKRIVKELPEYFPVLNSNVEHDWQWSYSEIWKGLIWLWKDKLTKINFANSSINRFKEKNWKEMRDYYNTLFKQKNLVK